MMDNFSQILQILPMSAAEASSTSNHFASAMPFKVRVNFDIPLFEGQIDADALEKWLNLLEGYYSVQKFSDSEKITFALLKSLPHVRAWWEGYWERYTADESTLFGREPTWATFVDALKDKLYPIRNYDDKYMRWTTLHQKRDQKVPEYTNIFHTLHSMMGIKDSERHLVSKYRSGLHRYIQTNMDFLDISSLGFAYRYAVKIEHKFKQHSKWETHGQSKEGQPQEIQSQMQAKKGNMKSKKDIGKWCEFHNNPWHNTNECCSIQSLVAELKDKESNPDLDPDSENNKRRQIIDTKPIVTVATATIQPEEDPEEGERLFHSQMWVKGTPLHFIVDRETKRTSSHQRLSSSWICQQHHTHNHTTLGGFAKVNIFMSVNNVAYPMASSPSRMRYCVMLPHWKSVMFYYANHTCGGVMLFMSLDPVASLLL
jgi:hypothetical protein